MEKKERGPDAIHGRPRTPEGSGLKIPSTSHPSSLRLPELCVY